MLPSLEGGVSRMCPSFAGDGAGAGSSADRLSGCSWVSAGAGSESLDWCASREEPPTSLIMRNAKETYYVGDTIV